MEKKQRKSRSKKEVEDTVVRIAEVKILRKYHDTRFNKVLEPGDGFECSQERAKELVNAKVAEIICLKNSL